MNQTKSPIVYIYDDVVLNSRPWRAQWPLLNVLKQTINHNKLVTFLDPFEQINALLPSYESGRFDLVIGIGKSGHQIARLLNQYSGQDYPLLLAELSRQEISPNNYQMNPVQLAKVAEELKDLTGKRVAIVDDTLYSGLTIHSILDLLPSDTLQQTEIFVLQGIEDSLPTIMDRCLVRIGFVMVGKREKDATIIKTSNLFIPGAIIQIDGKSQAFCDRPKLMAEWFPVNSKQVIKLCRQLRESVNSPQRAYSKGLATSLGGSI